MREIKARTLDLKREPNHVREAWRQAVPEADKAHALRPRTRGECVESVRPCPWVGCRENLYLVAGNGRIKLNFPDLEPHELAVSCALDVADDGPATLSQVGQAMNMTRERVRQIEERALDRLFSDPEIREGAIAVLGYVPTSALRKRHTRRELTITERVLALLDREPGLMRAEVYDRIVEHDAFERSNVSQRVIKLIAEGAIVEDADGELRRRR